jgi:hypothetical protein
MAACGSGQGTGHGQKVTALRLEADIELSIDGITLRATGDDGILVVTTPRWLPIAHRLRQVAGPRLRLQTIAAELAEVGATVRLDSEAGPLLYLGAGANPSRIGRSLGLHHLGTASPAVLWRHSRALRTAVIIPFAVVAVLWARRRRSPR